MATTVKANFPPPLSHHPCLPANKSDE